jgi:hypothetical protein
MPIHHYENVEVQKMKGGKKIVRKVSIKNGKGFKSVTKFHRGKHLGTVKKPLARNQIRLILVRRFVPNLFSDCNAKNAYNQPRVF